MKNLFRGKLLLPAVLLFFPGCLGYLFHVSSHQISHLWNRRPTGAVITDDRAEEKTRAKLLLVNRVITFAVNRWDLIAGNYRDYVAVDRPVLAWNVVASRPLSFEPHLWWFPVVGHVPYKGFFRRDLAEAEEKILREEGYDTRIQAVAAYSTLGWFSDPVFSTFLQDSDADIISLLIHEMTHSRFYINGDGDFNESLASFTEEKATIAFLTAENRPDLLEEYGRSQQQRKKFHSLLHDTAVSLDAIYRARIPDENKLRLKQAEFAALKRRAAETGLDRLFPGFFRRNLNNADLAGSRRYHSGEKFFNRLWLESGEKPAEFFRGLEKLRSIGPAERARLLAGDGKP